MAELYTAVSGLGGLLAIYGSRFQMAEYLAVVVVQAAALANERAELAVLGRRLVASVNLIKALGGGWEVPPDRVATRKQGLLPGPNPFWPSGTPFP